MLKKLNNIILAAIFVFFFGTCHDGSQKQSISIKDDTECLMDYEFISNYQNCLNIILFWKQGQVAVNDVGPAFHCLSALTGHKSKVQAGDIGYYYYDYPPNQFENDIGIWLQWLDENKCTFDMEKSEKIFKINRKPLPDYSDTSVISLIQSRYQEGSFSIEADSLGRIESQLDWPKSMSEMHFFFEYTD